MISVVATDIIVQIIEQIIDNISINVNENKNTPELCSTPLYNVQHLDIHCTKIVQI